MRERRTEDRGLNSRRPSAPHCSELGSETLAAYMMRSISKADLPVVEAHLQGCDECWAVLESTYRLFACH